MNFLYPQFLYAFIALAIPVIVHLFNFRKTKKVYFSNTRFLQKVKESSSSKRKIKHYLILLSRLMALAFLILAFAQPFLPSIDNISTSGKTIIYLDNSLSMNNEVEEGASAFGEAMRHINTLINIYPSSSQYKLLTNDFLFSGSYKSKKEISELTTEMNMSAVGRSGDEIYKRLLLQKEQDEMADVFWISDFQTSTLGDATIAFDSTFNVNLIPLSFLSEKNVYVDSLYLDNPFLSGDEKKRLNVKLRNIGEEEVNDLIVKVYVDEAQAATASVNILPNNTVTTTFDLAFAINGIHKCRIGFEEFPVTFDNDFYFTINGSQKISILEIKSSDQPTAVTKVFGNTDLFDTKSINISNLDYSLIPEADLVVVNALPAIDPSLSIVLNKYIAEDGNVLIIPAAIPDVASYRQITGLGAVTPLDSMQKVSLASPDFNDPFYENVFEETNKSFAMPEARGVITWGRDRTALLKYKNGLPFLSEKQSDGSVYLFGAPLDINYTTLQAHALFVPIMYRIAAKSASSDARLYYFTDNPQVNFKSDTLVNDNIFKLARDGEEIIPVQRVTGSNVAMEIPKYSVNAGFYDLTYKGQVVSTLAFNTSPAESDLRQLDRKSLGQYFKGKVEVFEVDNEEGFKNSVEKKYIGQSLWKYAVILALFFLLIEVLLIRFMP